MGINVTARYTPPNLSQAFEAGRMAYLKSETPDVPELGPWPDLEMAWHQGWERERDDYLEYLKML